MIIHYVPGYYTLKLNISKIINGLIFFQNCHILWCRLQSLDVVVNNIASLATSKVKFIYFYFTLMCLGVTHTDKNDLIFVVLL